MKYLQKKRLWLGIIISIIAFSTVIYAHSGRTDSSGGHKDKNNVSGLGGYHYHCGGKPAHLHTNGVCPYDEHSNSNYSTTSKNGGNTYTKTNNTSTTPKKIGNNEERNQEEETNIEEDDKNKDNTMIGAGTIGVGGIIGYSIYKSKKKK